LLDRLEQMQQKKQDAAAVGRATKTKAAAKAKAAKARLNWMLLKGGSAGKRLGNRMDTGRSGGEAAREEAASDEYTADAPHSKCSADASPYAESFPQEMQQEGQEEQAAHMREAARVDAHAAAVDDFATSNGSTLIGRAFEKTSLDGVTNYQSRGRRPPIIMRKNSSTNSSVSGWARDSAVGEVAELVRRPSGDGGVDGNSRRRRGGRRRTTAVKAFDEKNRSILGKAQHTRSTKVSDGL
jgi:hypothetical protein